MGCLTDAGFGPEQEIAGCSLGAKPGPPAISLGMGFTFSNVLEEILIGTQPGSVDLLPSLLLH